MDKNILEKIPADVAGYISNLEAEIARLNELLRCANRSLYGRSSEKTRYILNNPNQLSLFNEAEVYADEVVLDKTQITVTYIRKKKRTKEELAKSLPVVEEIIELPESERQCDVCDGELSAIGKELVRRELCVIPAKAYVKEIYVVSYSCKDCLNESDEANITKAQAPVPVISHGLASPSSVAYTVYQKYVNALPLDRQEKDWARFGVRISRATLANWVIYTAGKWLSVLVLQLKSVLLLSPVIHSDDTVIQVLHEEGKTPQSESRMWVYRTSYTAMVQIVLFEYRPGRNGEYPVKYLEKAAPGFYLQTDGSSSYHNVAGAVFCGCWAHQRRKFDEALPQTGKEESPAAKGLAFCRKLFALEERFKDLSPEERLEQRLLLSKPVTDAFFEWVETVNPLKGSKLSTAITYALNQRQPLCSFLLDGRVSIDNNAAENAIRPFVRGRMNWLFSDTVNGAEASAVCYSLTETARANGLNPYKYLEYLLTELPQVLHTNPGADLSSFFPWTDDARHKCRMDNMGADRIIPAADGQTPAADH